MRYTITLSYCGAGYCGWQIQDNAVTVQGELERALKIMLHEEIKLTGAGRTDTGVNAINYVAHFDSSRMIANERKEEASGDAPAPIEATHLLYKINAIVGHGIVVHDIRRCAPGFHARFDATRREYKYFVHRKKDPFRENSSYRVPYPLDVAAMNEAARLLLGEHDFSSFEKAGGDNTTSVCTVFEASWESFRPADAMPGYEEGDYLVFRIAANRFLRNMVRAVVGSLLEVGRGRRSPEWIGELLSCRSRSLAGQSVPGKALFFTGAAYPDAE